MRQKLNNKYYFNYEVSIGRVYCFSDGSNLTGLYFSGQKNKPTIQSNAVNNSHLEIFDQLKQQLDSFFNLTLFRFNLPIKFSGTSFQLKVWAALAEIPYGTTKSYSELAFILGVGNGSRAIANAISRNPMSIVIPCHRVIRKNGQIGGYAGGIDRKKQLLSLETSRNIF